jgi:sarcosine oxidase subunit delta
MRRSRSSASAAVGSSTRLLPLRWRIEVDGQDGKDIATAMLLINCPYCEELRPELEFRNAGEAHIARPENIAASSDEEFEAFFFIRSNPRGPIAERWRHVHGCGRFFNAIRDTVSDRFLTTYRAGEPKPDLSKLKVAGGPAAGANRPAAGLTSRPAKDQAGRAASAGESE